MLQYLSCTIRAVLSTVKGKECLGKRSTFWRALPDIEKTSHICTCLNTHSMMRMLGIVCSLILNMLMCHVSFALIININQSACSTLDWALISQSDFGQVLYKHHWDFPKHNRGNFKVLMPLLDSRFKPFALFPSDNKSYHMHLYQQRSLPCWEGAMAWQMQREYWEYHSFKVWQISNRCVIVQIMMRNRNQNRNQLFWETLESESES